MAKNIAISYISSEPSKDKVEERLRQLSPKSIQEELDEDGRTVLHHAVSTGQSLSLLTWLLDNCFHSALLQDEEGWTPLHIACTMKQIDAVKTLLSHPSSLTSKQQLELIHSQTSSGQTALHYCASKGFLAGLAYLLQSGASPSIKDKNGMLPIHRSASTGQLAVFQHLIQCKGSPDSWVSSTDNAGNTILHLAVENQHLDIIRDIIKRCSLPAMWHQKNKDGQTPLSLATPEILSIHSSIK
jgi:26S proteasome non-ATPase regulatory subunit 10